MCSHAFASNYATRGGLTAFIGRVLYYGYFGVDLFFVLSGFLITGILFDSQEDEGYFSKFYARRALRIFPLYYGVLLVCLLLTCPLHLQWHGMGWLLLLYLQNIHPAQIQNYSPGAGIGLFHFWSLSVEEQFYLAWPAVVFLIRKRETLLVATLVGSAAALGLRLVILAYGWSYLAIQVTTACRADSLLLGGTLALLYRSPSWKRVTTIAPWIFLAAATIVLGSITLGASYFGTHVAQRYDWELGPRYTIVAVGFACLIAWSLCPQSWCSRFFKIGPLRFLGKYSYGIYVLHVVMISAINLPLRSLILRATHDKMASVVVAGISSLALSVAAAYLSYNLYERPFLRLKHRFDYNRDALNHGAPEDVTPAPQAE
jgi:peptidoglycan/LPS O-acetylase OafA/YrhL